MIDPDDFEAWLANPITQHVMKMLREDAEAAKAAWLSHSWDGGGTETSVLFEMRGRAFACEMITGLTVEDLQGDDE